MVDCFLQNLHLPTSAIPTLLGVVPHAAAAPKATAARLLEALHGVQVHETLLTQDASHWMEGCPRAKLVSWEKKHGGSDDLMI